MRSDEEVTKEISIHGGGMAERVKSESPFWGSARENSIERVSIVIRDMLGTRNYAFLCKQPALRAEKFILYLFFAKAERENNLKGNIA